MSNHFMIFYTTHCIVRTSFRFRFAVSLQYYHRYSIIKHYKTWMLLSRTYFFFVRIIFRRRFVLHFYCSHKNTLSSMLFLSYASRKVRMTANKTRKYYSVLLLAFVCILHNTQWRRNRVKIVEIVYFLWHYVHFLTSISAYMFLIASVATNLLLTSSFFFFRLLFIVRMHLYLYCFMIYRLTFIYECLQN